MALPLPPILFCVHVHSVAPSYLADELHHPAESEFRRRLRSASSHELSVLRTRLSTHGDRAFPVVAVRIWNTSIRSTSHPRRHFTSSALAWRHTSNCVIHKTFVVPAKWHRHFGHVNRFYLLTYLLTYMTHIIHTLTNYKTDCQMNYTKLIVNSKGYWFNYHKNNV